jgi:primase-polymerase (primpol)-like protein
VRHPALRASSTDSQTWATFDEAVAVVEQANGIGFVFSVDDPYFGVDLDGGLSEADKGAVLLALNTYAEGSVSGAGYHVIGRGRLPKGSRNRRGPLEVYDSGRYFVVTGLHVRGTPMTIEERQSELEAVLQQFMPTRETPEFQLTRELIDMDDRDLIERALRAKNGTTFARLFAGDTSGYASHSEADAALCSHLAFWTGNDKARIDSIFRRSRLMREKWERADYRESTIARSLSVDVFQPSAMTRPTPRNRLGASESVESVADSQGRTVGDGLTDSALKESVGRSQSSPVFLEGLGLTQTPSQFPHSRSL